MAYRNQDYGCSVYLTSASNLGLYHGERQTSSTSARRTFGDFARDDFEHFVYGDDRERDFQDGEPLLEVQRRDLEHCLYTQQPSKHE